ncbi:sugar ABC transporter ATP-binding protein [Murdochiella vaginalis]|uniref:sugar ABC transporter ATP-binding protein n=1 Tax=Murdochiella vaginalis TaxID=1852373 RepID=UPI0013904DFD|nr:sugar ABC transporter ATP-binding protein [Murdochiella vaginalis]
MKDVSFSVREGEVHCLVGENGAGKSTLIKILCGAYSIDNGELRIDGQPVRIETPAQAAAKGIAVVYQDVTNVDKLSIADNIVLGAENSRCGFNQQKKNIEFVRPFLNQVGLEIEPTALMETLSIAQKQMVMIAKALSKKARLIVLDEPTAMLNEQEVHTLFQIICSLRDSGITVVYISHRMEEIYRIGDRVTVLKDGGYVGTWDLSSINPQQLIVKMVGRELGDVYPNKHRPIGKELLRVENLTTEKIDGVSFALHEGEVIGLAGLVGSGRTEVLRAIFAADKLYGGKIVLEENELSLSSPMDAIRSGIGLLPEDRKRQGIVSCLTVKDNITLLYSQLNAKYGFLKKADDDAITRHYIDDLRIKTPSAMQEVGNLSGGNQQKVVVSKWLSISPRVLLLDEPTQGIDVGAKADIYQLINRLARQGMGVIVVSSDLIEIINLSNRIVVMRDGHVAKILTSDELTEERVMLYAMGVNTDEKA